MNDLVPTILNSLRYFGPSMALGLSAPMLRLQTWLAGEQKRASQVEERMMAMLVMAASLYCFSPSIPVWLIAGVIASPLLLSHFRDGAFWLQMFTLAITLYFASRLLYSSLFGSFFSKLQSTLVIAGICLLVMYNKTQLKTLYAHACQENYSLLKVLRQAGEALPQLACIALVAFELYQYASGGVLATALPCLTALTWFISQTMISYSPLTTEAVRHDWLRSLTGHLLSNAYVSALLGLGLKLYSQHPLMALTMALPASQFGLPKQMSQAIWHFCSHSQEKQEPTLYQRMPI